MSSFNRRVLVVDDDPASCELVAYCLKSVGYDVAIAPDGTRALNLDLNDDDIELVILDLHMPGRDGAEVLLALRGRHARRPVRFLAVTADESSEARQAMLDSGADGFLTKPLDLDLLRDEVARLVPGVPQHEGPLHRRARERRLNASPRPTVSQARATIARRNGWLE